MKTTRTTKSNATKSTKAAAVALLKIAETGATAKTPAAAAAPRREITPELIAARAYTLWEQQGRPQGRDLQNWLQAETQLKQEIQSFTA